MGLGQQQPSDLRAKADDYRDRAARVEDPDLKGQFLDLSQRYLELANQLEDGPYYNRVLPSAKAGSRRLTLLYGPFLPDTLG